ncbi:signal recognition particle protein [Solobacterium moorei]|uniref:signal recognition particle protein n=1 Tax=Solobacterium moorei TaxID=102148 RepID=UPI000401351A|nr:signal recognition particle protein [Solobacterium moorei]MDI6415459.1 signal recognition particle protein [Solobacterium moorei]BET22218.1 signal recognition particle protein [Solobacterium moorei]
MAFDSLSDRLNKALRNVAGKGTLTDNNMEDMLKEVRLALLEADVNYRIVKEFLDEIRTKSRGEEVLQSVEPGQQLVKIVHDQIIELLGTEEAGLNFVEDGITKIMLVGLQGTGKTTSVAKIARICKEKFNKKVLLIAADVIRPAAIDQLQTLGKEIDTEVFTLGTETPAVETVRQGMEYAEKNGFDTVFIDTAGRLHIDEALMNELKDINELVHPNDILLTVDAMTGQDIVNVAQAFKDALPLTGLVVTKFDGDSRGGGVLSVKKITGVPIKFVGEGEKIEDMDIFHPDRMADRILGMGDVVTLVEKAQEKLDLEEANKMAERMLAGQFTMDDMLKQFEQIQKLGPLGGIMKMIPGMNQYAGMLDEAKASDSMRHMKAIIQSMTLEERAHPEKMRGTMKKRVARGSGRSVDEVNKLINQFGKMKKLMDSMGNMQRNGSLNQESLEKMMGNAQKRAGQNFPNGFGGRNPFKF